VSELPLAVLHDLVHEAAPRAELEPNHDQCLRHDLRQSLCTVMALVSILERNQLLAPQALERLEQIQREAGWMATLISSGGAERAKVRVVDVGEAVTEAWSLVAAAAPCDVRLVRESGAYSLVDPVALRRSARNLMENAVRAAGTDGCVEVRILTRDSEVVLEVADDGPGYGKMPHQEGLGMQTVGGFVDRFGGRLVIGTSDLGGALVGFRLPITSPDDEGSRP
jgi:K+-sensing histidine kinase KdpD